MQSTQIRECRLIIKESNKRSLRILPLATCPRLTENGGSKRPNVFANSYKKTGLGQFHSLCLIYDTATGSDLHADNISCSTAAWTLLKSCTCQTTDGLHKTGGTQHWLLTHLGCCHCGNLWRCNLVYISTGSSSYQTVRRLVSTLTATVSTSNPTPRHRNFPHPVKSPVFSNPQIVYKQRPATPGKLGAQWLISHTRSNFTGLFYHFTSLSVSVTAANRYTNIATCDQLERYKTLLTEATFSYVFHWQHRSCVNSPTGSLYHQMTHFAEYSVNGVENYLASLTSSAKYNAAIPRKAHIPYWTASQRRTPHVMSSVNCFIPTTSCVMASVKKGMLAKTKRISLLKTKRNLLYIRNQFVPRSKHFPPWL